MLEKIKISILKGRLIIMDYCCADCVYMDLNDENSYGDYWCEKRGKYYPGGDNTCSYFEPHNRSDPGGCYITTAVCENHNKTDACYELNVFRNFRDNWLKKQSDGESLINDYYEIAPLIVTKINNLPNATQIYRFIWQKYLNPCFKLIENGDNQACKNLYIKMVKILKATYLKF
jgi:hypothetical protein